MRWALAAMTGVGVALLASPARAEPHRLTYDWPRFSANEAAYTVSAFASYSVVERFAPVPVVPRWSSPILFDAPAASFFAQGSWSARRRAGIASDVLWYGSQVIAWFDAVVVPVAFDDANWSVAGELALENLEVLGPVALASRLGHRFVARARPTREGCRKDRKYEPFCDIGPNASFPSGHTAVTMAAAGLTCAHHRYLPLYGGGAPDTAMCAAVVGMGVVDGVLRLMAERHYASDVLFGAAFGFAAGYFIPVAFHYGRERTRGGGPVNGPPPAVTTRAPLSLTLAW